jgi:L-cysteine desulfidase
MERILLAELRLLAEVFGPESVAGVAYELASALDAPMVVRHGKLKTPSSSAGSGDSGMTAVLPLDLRGGAVE